MFDMRRREFVSLLGGAAAAWPLAARGQQAAIPVVGLLHGTLPEARRAEVAEFHRGLSKISYVEGRNVAVEYRWAEGNYDRLPALAADLVKRQVSVIAAFGTAAALVASADLAVKALEILKEAVPYATRFAVFLTPSAPWHRSFLQAAKVAGTKLGVQVHTASVQTVEDLDGAFAMAVRERVDGILVQPTSLSRSHRAPLADLALKHRLPSMFGGREYVEAGGLMSYAADYVDLTRRAATYIDKILKGSKPADLPVELASKYLLAINLTTAKKLELNLPWFLQQRADEVIE
jgi:ABC-type uncharacterized transport system substrate-binding protein